MRALVISLERLASPKSSDSIEQHVSDDRNGG